MAHNNDCSFYMANSRGVINDGEARPVRVRFDRSVAHRVKTP